MHPRGKPSSRLRDRAFRATLEGYRTAFLARSTVLLPRLEGQPAELVIALLPSFVRAMDAAVVEIMAEARGARADVGKFFKGIGEGLADVGQKLSG
jgi:hypothetical protein